MAHQSIASFTEVLVALGLSDLSTLAATDAGLAQMVHGHAEGAVKQILGYSPIQATRTEYYPTRDEVAGAMLHESDEYSYATVRPLTHSTRAELSGHRVEQIEGDKLCLRHIPVRSITALYEDTDGSAGQGSGKFPAATLLTLDADYWIDLDEDGYSRSGFVFREGVWPAIPRSIKVTYVGGYTPDEFAGFGDIDASSIKHAVLLTAVAMFKALKLQQANSQGVFANGPLKSEKLGDYSYTLSDATGTNLSSFSFEPGIVPEVAEMALQPFIHMHRTSII